MQYPLFTILELFTITIALLIGTAILHFLIKRWKKADFSTVLKVIALYVVGTTIFSFLINSLISETEVTRNTLSKILFVGLAFILYYSLSRKYLELSPRKTMVSFFIVIVLVLPVLGFLRSTLMHQASDTPLLREETERMRSYFWEQAGEKGYDSTIYINSVPLVVLGEIEKATFGWPSEIFFK